MGFTVLNNVLRPTNNFGVKVVQLQYSKKLLYYFTNIPLGPKMAGSLVNLLTNLTLLTTFYIEIYKKK